jgi:hypothetical protein
MTAAETPDASGGMTPAEGEGAESAAKPAEPAKPGEAPKPSEAAKPGATTPVTGVKPAEAAAAKTFALKLATGDSLKYKTSVKQEVKAQGTSQHIEYDITQVYDVKKSAGTEVELEQKVTDVKVGTGTTDSVKQSVTGMMDAMKQRTVPIVVKPNGQFKGRSLGAQMSQGGGLASDTFTGIIFPTKPVKIGDTWTHERDMKDAGAPGDVEWKNSVVKTVFTFKSFDAAKGIAQITFTSNGKPSSTQTMTMPPQAEGAEPVKMTMSNSMDMKVTGTVWVRIKDGVTTKLDTSATIKMANTANGRSQNMDVVQKQTMTLL